MLHCEYRELSTRPFTLSPLFWQQAREIFSPFSFALCICKGVGSWKVGSKHPIALFILLESMRYCDVTVSHNPHVNSAGGCGCGRG